MTEDIVHEKTCIKCRNLKSITDFGPRKDRAHGYTSHCKPCINQSRRESRKRHPQPRRVHDPLKYRASVLKTRFGLTFEQYNQMLAKQGGVCAICKTKPNSKALSVDHCHKTGKIRGLLCDKCNPALGWFRDNIDYLKSAIHYLQSHS